MNIKKILIVLLSLLPVNIIAVVCFTLLSKRYSLLINIMILAVFDLAMLGFAFLCSIYNYNAGYCNTFIVMLMFVVYAGLTSLICLLPCIFNFVEFSTINCNEFAFIVGAVVLLQMEITVCIGMHCSARSASFVRGQDK